MITPAYLRRVVKAGGLKCCNPQCNNFVSNAEPIQAYAIDEGTDGLLVYCQFTCALQHIFMRSKKQ